MHQLFVRVFVEVAEEGAVALRLALLGAAEHGVDLVDRLARQQAAQEHHGIADGGQVGLEIAARDTEQVGDIAAPGQYRIGAQTVLVVDQGNDAGREAVFAEYAADQVGAALAVEHGIEQLDAAHRRIAPVGEVILQADGNRCRAAQLVRVRHVEAVIGQHPLQGLYRARG